LSFLQSGKANLGEELYKVLTADSNTAEEMLNSLDLKSEHSALEAVNKLEAAIFAWKERVTAQVSGRSPVRTSWSFVKDPVSEFDKMESLLDSAESLLQLLKSRYPNLPQTFLDSTKVQYGKVSSILDLWKNHFLAGKKVYDCGCYFCRTWDMQSWKHIHGFLETWHSAFCLG
jgi:hypothetical protein